ncbi:sensitive to high expression protein 9-like protein, mitochondrial [Myxozyma melibiosi]|uniref:Sensitive to high expression protein 9, mitochondrial n=1 Tax=Myxozyma melibiosi TaxID=54550 RepID=A0ABR1F7W2_9ASCO
MLRNLPSQIEARRSRLARRFSAKLDELQTAVFMAGRTINDITGYSEIDALRKAIERQEAALLEARKEVKNAKDAYSAAIAKRSASQREVNELLQRKQTWSPSDLERFTILYRSDHANEQEELHAGERLNRAEHAAEEAQAELGRSILARYHEEQIWSDKIRRASTYGTWALMGFNVVLFMVVQLGLEPWKRKRLVGSFEEKVRDMLDERKIISPETPEQPTPDVQEVLDMPEGLLPDTPSVVQSSHKAFSAHSAKEALLLLKQIFIGKEPDGKSVSSSTIYESTRAELAIFSGASAVAGAAVVGLVAALIRISFS